MPALFNYRVFVDDNYHPHDENERYPLGAFSTCVDAVAACQRVVDEFLLLQYNANMTADELWEIYTNFGEDPFIIAPDHDNPLPCLFSAWDYARARCEIICRSPNSG